MDRLTRNSIPGVICGLIILVLTGLPGSFVPEFETFWEWLGPDKIAHLIMFGGFVVATVWGYRNKIKDDNNFRKKLILRVLIIAVIFSALTEVMQKYLIPGRYGSWFDFYADVIGVIIGFFILRWIPCLNKKTK